MSKSIYRKAALERLSSPEQLDQSIPITNPRGWLILGAMIALLLAAAFWGIFGTVTEQIATRSVLINSGGIRNIVATHAGQVSSLGEVISIDGSSSIDQGDLVAVIGQPEDSSIQEIHSPFTGRILEVKVAEGDLVDSGDDLLSLEFTGEDVKLESVLFLPASQAGAVKEGMEVRFTPDGLPPGISGHIVGRVTSIGDFPSSRESLLRILGSEELIQALSISQAPIAIYVDFLDDPESPDGLRWSSPPSTDLGFRSGAIGTAEIILEENRPISYLLSGGR